MPGPKSLFGKKTSFVPKKSAPARRSASLTSLNRLDESTYSAADLKGHLSADPESSSRGVVRLRLGDSELAFDREEGTWFLENSSGGGGMTRGAVKELARLRKQNVQLAEENNLLKYKLEVMVDMLVASNADANAQSRDLQTLRKRS
ncbi:protein chibby homolog 1-like [Sycon ciliatum]|uniref:protein chibby homolog 1-like n=1 Tax=Sycon ciliatum TaxID=27933 RepID=UPI0020A8E22D|eukprot:scpid88443/ scgid9087/ Protein chibby homolog 1; Cytosolic leucine-rich protein; PIGEA-14; PKD2 interactor, Golgi and endoplasmic reticulum-associated 1